MTPRKSRGNRAENLSDNPIRNGPIESLSDAAGDASHGVAIPAEGDGIAYRVFVVD
jgi:hypothetical protein